MVQCESCLKQMTKNTLRYHHKCPGKPVDKNLPVKRRIKKDEPKSEPKIEAKQPTSYRDKLNQSLKKRTENISKLALQIA